MVNWTYNPENYGKIQRIAPGNYRVRIEKAEEAVSKNTGKDMIKLTVKVSGQNPFIYHYITFPTIPSVNATAKELEDFEIAKERTDNSLGRIFDSFGIKPGDMNLMNWQGKVGAAEIINETDNQGNLQNRVKFFIKRDQQGLLPAWQEKTVQAVKQASVNADMVNPDDNNCPF